MCDYEDPPRTFPGGGWYAPEISAVASISTLPLPEDKKKLAAIKKAEEARSKRGVGFTANA